MSLTIRSPLCEYEQRMYWDKSINTHIKVMEQHRRQHQGLHCC